MGNTFWLSVAGITLEIRHDTGLSARNFSDKYLDSLFFEYLSENIAAPDYVIYYKRSKNYVSAGEYIMRCNLYRVKKLGEVHRLEFSRNAYDADERHVCHTMEIAPGFGSAEIVEYTDCEAPPVSFRYVLRVFFEGIALYQGAFVLHGATVDYKGSGIIFTAPSGTGKTTHAEFWVKELGASVLNGDSPIIRADGGAPYICGSPWCGSSNDSVKRDVPLKAIVILQRGDENKIEKVSESSAIYEILPEIRRMLWVNGQACHAMDFLEMLLKRSSIYRLQCLPEPASARIALKGMGLDLR